MPLTVEQSIKILESSIWSYDQSSKVTKPYDVKFIQDISMLITNGRAISTNQAKLALKLISIYSKVISERRNIDLEEVNELVKNPVYARQPYESIHISREVRYLKNNLLAFRFKYSTPIIEDVKSLHPNEIYSEKYPVFNKLHKIWIVKITRHNVDRVMAIIKKHKFNFDDELAQFFANVLNSDGQKPNISIKDGKIIINVPNDEIFISYINNVLLNTEKFNVRSL